MPLAQAFGTLELRIGSAANDQQSLKSVMDYFFGVVYTDPDFATMSNGPIVDAQINGELTAYGRDQGYLRSNQDMSGTSFTFAPDYDFLFGKFVMGRNTGFFLYSLHVRKGVISVVDPNCQPDGVCYSLFPVPSIVATATAQPHADLIRTYSAKGGVAKKKKKSAK
jgi:hypothetical protein